MQRITLDVRESCHLYILFDPTYNLDFNSWKIEKILKIEMVRGHPHVECITLQGEVNSPNLQIQPSTLEFGCILAGTKQKRSVKMTNSSSLPVKYHWSFQMDGYVKKMRYVHLCPVLEVLLPGVLFVLCKEQSCFCLASDKLLLPCPCADNTDLLWSGWMLRK